MRISDLSSDVCSSDLHVGLPQRAALHQAEAVHAGKAQVDGEGIPQLRLALHRRAFPREPLRRRHPRRLEADRKGEGEAAERGAAIIDRVAALDLLCPPRSEEHTSELQSLMRTSYAVFCL